MRGLPACQGVRTATGMAPYRELIDAQRNASWARYAWLGWPRAAPKAAIPANQSGPSASQQLPGRDRCGNSGRVFCLKADRSVAPSFGSRYTPSH